MWHLLCQALTCVMIKLLADRVVLFLLFFMRVVGVLEWCCKLNLFCFPERAARAGGQEATAGRVSGFS